MSQVLGRVIGRELDGPRGPDVAHRVRVPQDWIDDAAVIEVELPRHLHCAVCEGGGCDLCDRSGAHTLRSRGEPAEIVEVTLPRREQERRDDQEKGPGSSSTPISRSFVIRIPELGGLPPQGSELPRGHLLLTVAPAPTPDTGVKLVERLPVPEKPSTALAAPAPPQKRSDVQRVLLVLLAVIAWIALLIYLRLSGLA